MWLRQHDRAVRAEAQSEVLAAQVDTLRERVVQDSLESAHKDSVILAQQDSLVDVRRAVLVLEGEAIRNSTRLGKTLREQIAADLQPMFDSLTASYEYQLELKDEQIAIEKELTELERQKVAARDTTIMAMREFQAGLEARIRQLEDQNEESLIDKAQKIAPWVVAAYVLGRSSR